MLENHKLELFCLMIDGYPSKDNQPNVEKSQETQTPEASSSPMPPQTPPQFLQEVIPEETTQATTPSSLEPDGSRV